MSYTRDIPVGKKVTVTASKEGYQTASIVIDSMPNQDITREIRLLANPIEIEVVYGPNCENPGAIVQSYNGIIGGGTNNKIFVNGVPSTAIQYPDNILVYSLPALPQNDTFPDFTIDGNQYTIQCGNPNMFPWVSHSDNGGISYICNYPQAVFKNLSNGNKYTIPLYKRIDVGITYTYIDRQTIKYGCNNVYCSEIDDYPLQSFRNSQGNNEENYGVSRLGLAIGYTYTFVFKTGNTYQTRTFTINPTAQQLQDGIIILNFDL